MTQTAIIRGHLTSYARNLDFALDACYKPATMDNRSMLQLTSYNYIYVDI